MKKRILLFPILAIFLFSCADDTDTAGASSSYVLSSTMSDSGIKITETLMDCSSNFSSSFIGRNGSLEAVLTDLGTYSGMLWLDYAYLSERGNGVSLAYKFTMPSDETYIEKLDVKARCSQGASVSTSHADSFSISLKYHTTDSKEITLEKINGSTGTEITSIGIEKEYEIKNNIDYFILQFDLSNYNPLESYIYTFMGIAIDKFKLS